MLPRASLADQPSGLTRGNVVMSSVDQAGRWPRLKAQPDSMHRMSAEHGIEAHLDTSETMVEFVLQ